MTEPIKGDIYAAIPKIIGEIKAVGKDRKNSQQGYAFRSIDDVYPVLQPLLAKHGVSIIPNVTHCDESQQTTGHGKIMWRVTMMVRYDIYATDGSSINAVVRAEAMDTSDKASYKAMSMALKYLVFQVFFPPIANSGADAENDSPEATAPTPPDPADIRKAKLDKIKKAMKGVQTCVEHYMIDGMTNTKGKKIAWLKPGQTLDDLSEDHLNYTSEHVESICKLADEWFTKQQQQEQDKEPDATPEES